MLLPSMHLAMDAIMQLDGHLNMMRVRLGSASPLQKSKLALIKIALMYASRMLGIAVYHHAAHLRVRFRKRGVGIINPLPLVGAQPIEVQKTIITSHLLVLCDGRTGESYRQKQSRTFFILVSLPGSAGNRRPALLFLRGFLRSRHSEQEAVCRHSLNSIVSRGAVAGRGGAA